VWSGLSEEDFHNLFETIAYSYNEKFSRRNCCGKNIEDCHYHFQIVRRRRSHLEHSSPQFAAFKVMNVAISRGIFIGN
jgi:hypothetical protein